eukprot:scaffold116_cov334-Pavlova_lutheri.AAC.77
MHVFILGYGCIGRGLSPPHRSFGLGLLHHPLVLGRATRFFAGSRGQCASRIQVCGPCFQGQCIFDEFGRARVPNHLDAFRWPVQHFLRLDFKRRCLCFDVSFPSLTARDRRPSLLPDVSVSRRGTRVC